MSADLRCSHFVVGCIAFSLLCASESTVLASLVDKASYNKTAALSDGHRYARWPAFNVISGSTRCISATGNSVQLALGSTLCLRRLRFIASAALPGCSGGGLPCPVVLSCTT